MLYSSKSSSVPRVEITCSDTGRSHLVFIPLLIVHSAKQTFIVPRAPGGSMGSAVNFAVAFQALFCPDIILLRNIPQASSTSCFFILFYFVFFLGGVGRFPVEARILCAG